MDILDDMGVSKLSAKVFFQELKKKNFKKKNSIQMETLERKIIHKRRTRNFLSVVCKSCYSLTLSLFALTHALPWRPCVTTFIFT